MKTSRILVVDDDELLARGYARILEKAGYAVTVCHSGEEALATISAAETRPDLVLLDVALPGIDGVEVCRRIKNQRATATCVVVQISGTRVSSGEQADSLETGADGYLIKPVDSRVLLAHIRALLRWRASEAALLDQQLAELRHLADGHTDSTNQSLDGEAMAQGSGGGMSLRRRMPTRFEAICAQYASLLDLSLNERVYKGDHEALQAEVRLLAAALGGQQASARDVVEVHTETLQRKLAATAPRRLRGYVEEGRLLLVELMGYLLMFYRNRTL